LTGLHERSALWKTLVPALSRRYELSRGPVARRYAVDLTDGVDGFLRNRSSGFRKNLSKAERRARQVELRFEIADDGAPEETFERLLAIERRSWKGRRGVGIDTDPMCAFYRSMNRRLVERGARRLLFATIEGNDAAYIFGGLFGKTYRGLQFSFDDRYSEHSLGNLCQLEEIRRLSDDGIESYDLGTEVPYKKRWGDRVFATSCLVVQPS
jgi:CelD/BcsL family acetyltransferase involved in cellulose biosynthesis